MRPGDRVRIVNLPPELQGWRGADSLLGQTGVVMFLEEERGSVAVVEDSCNSDVLIPLWYKPEDLELVE